MKKSRYQSPRIIQSKFECICAETGKAIKRGQSCLYFPSSKSVFHLDSKEVTDWRNNAMDEEVLTAQEPTPPYFTMEEAKGKFVEAFDTICEGLQCVKDENDIPVLFDSEQQVYDDIDFTDDENYTPDEYFPIPAVEFIEGRKYIVGMGANDKLASRIEGQPIVQEPEPKYNNMIKLCTAWKSNDADFIDVDFIRFDLTKANRLELLQAQQLVAENEYWSITVACHCSVTYLDDKEKESEEFRADVEQFRVDRGDIFFYAQHKHNSSCQIESEPFAIDPDTLEITTIID
jgi:hypothetical protein